MEEIVEYGFDDIKLPKVKFMAKFNPNTGAVVSVGPSIAFEHDEFKLPINEDVALMIIEGKISLSSCAVNFDSSQLAVVSRKKRRKSVKISLSFLVNNAMITGPISP